jgi:7-carboxy-7-deazaguanine synthase (Cx14CxxC type)
MSTYLVKEVFLTLQGEGAHAGRPAVFCRFTGCNLWTGREEHRATSVCRFCDTDFVGTDGPGGGTFRGADALAAHVRSFWPGLGRGFVVCTGGEPTLQLDDELVDALHTADLEIAIETNGTRPVPPGVDWVCLSPKAGAEVVLERADELKLVFPQAEPEAQPERWVDFRAGVRSLQPMDGPDRAANTAAAVAYCLAHPEWRLSVQTHKDIGIR